MSWREFIPAPVRLVKSRIFADSEVEKYGALVYREAYRKCAAFDKGR